MEERTVRVIGEAGRGSRVEGSALLERVPGCSNAGFLAIALFLLALHFISYAKAKAFFDWYVAAHGVSGNAGNYLTQEAFHRLSGRLPIAAGVFGICGVTLALFKRKLARFLLAIPSEWTGVRNFLLDQFQGGTQSALEIGIVFSVFAIGICLRVWHLGRAVRYDEAWTYVEFASRPLVIGLSNYTAPNNHLLNTLFIHFSTQLFWRYDFRTAVSDACRGMPGDTGILVRGPRALRATRGHFDGGLRGRFAGVHRVLRQRTRICFAVVVRPGGDVVRHRVGAKPVFANRLARTGGRRGCRYVQYYDDPYGDCRRLRVDVGVNARRRGGQQVQEHLAKCSAGGNSDRPVVAAPLRSTTSCRRSGRVNGEERRRVAAR